MRIGKLTVVFSLLALLLAACGGGDDGGGGGGGATAGGDGGTVIDGPLDAARCAQVVAAMAAAAQGSTAAMTGGAGDLAGSVEQIQAFASEAPEEIRDDLALIAEAYSQMMQAWSEAGYDPASGEPPTAEQIAALQAANASIGTTEFQEASDRVRAWFRTECGSG